MNAFKMEDALLQGNSSPGKCKDWQNVVLAVKMVKLVCYREHTRFTESLA